MSTLFVLDASVRKVVVPIFIGIATIVLANLINYLLKKSFKSAEHALQKHAEKTKDEYHKNKIAAEKTKFAFLRRVSVGIIYIVGIIFLISSVPSLKAFSYSLLAGAGVLAIIIGFATQKTLSNLIAGFMISVSQPIRVGDRVRFKDDYGIIQDITLRHTVLKTWDNRYVIIPNTMINEEVINNYTLGDERILATIEMNISYDSNIDLARKIIKEEIKKHPFFIDNMSEADMLARKDSVKVRVVGLNDFSVKLKGYYWVENQPKNIVSGYELTENIKKRFEHEGVEIPYPYRTIVYKKDMKKKIIRSTKRKPKTRKKPKKKR